MTAYDKEHAMFIHDVRGHYYIINWWRNANGQVVYNNFGLSRDQDPFNTEPDFRQYLASYLHWARKRREQQ